MRDFESLKLLSGEYWNVFLHEDQTVVGRVYFWSTDDVDDLLDVSAESLAEFHALGVRVRDALRTLYQPTQFNYLALGNKTPHPHIHLIPRYEHPITRYGHTFTDTNFGGSFQREKSLLIPDELYTAIRDDLIRTLA